MIIGRRSDFIAKIRIACAAWKREDTTLAITTQGHSIFITALDCVLKLTGVDDWENVKSWEDFPDAVFVEMYDLVSRRDPELKKEILAYFEKHNPRAKATAERQLKMEF